MKLAELVSVINKEAIRKHFSRNFLLTYHVTGHVLFSTHVNLKCIYDTKNIFCLFERPFKIQKNGIFLFEISFFVSEILSFLYYAN